MELEVVLAIAMFVSAVAALIAGYPVALTLGGVALLFALIGIALGFPAAALGARTVTRGRAPSAPVAAP